MNLKPLNFIILLGLVSLFADMVYEGVRGVLSPLFFNLGANSITIGFIFGIAEFLGWILRIFFGWLADKLKICWQMVFAGYVLGVLSVPFLGFVKSWQIASILVIMERLGKAIRSPSRDLLLSSVTTDFGKGKAFGIHEFFDQLGAISGPLLVGLLLFLKRDYSLSLSFLFFPGIICLMILSFAFKRYPVSLILKQESRSALKEKRLPLNFWFYSLFTLLAVVGFLNFPLIAYHLKIHNLFSDGSIAFLFGLAMGIDAITALVIGKIYDSQGFKSLLILPFLNILLVLTALKSDFIFIILGIIIWGIIMGIQETVMRAAVADLVVLEKRGVAYGIFNSIYGGGIFLGLAIMGFLYRISFLYIIIFSIVFEILSLPFLFLIQKEA
ncbi:MAG: MFS transporter [Candidatus Omnitrophica bacterium]|nr:MFS transporter [Candidatus Omnitrophota bacterium]